MAVVKKFAWFDSDGEGGIIGNKTDLDSFLNAGEEAGDDKWLEGITIIEIGTKYRVDVSTTYKLVEVK